MDKCSNWRSTALALVYAMSLLSGAFGRSQPLPDSKTKILPGSTNYTFKVGDVAELECPVKNLGDKKVVWRLAANDTIFTIGYNIFTEDPRVAVKHFNGMWNLVIRDVQHKDSGLYECQISSVEKHLRNYVALHVVEPQVKPVQKQNIHISGTTFVNERDSIELKCNATSSDYPIEDIDWFRDGVVLVTDENRGIQIMKKVSLSTRSIYSLLEIKHARLKDQGVYVCRTSNFDVTSIQVNVLNGDSYNVKRASSVTQEENGNGNAGNVARCQVASMMAAAVTWLISVHYVTNFDLT